MLFKTRNEAAIYAAGCGLAMVHIQQHGDYFEVVEGNQDTPTAWY